jgi:hypothetical protein
MPPDQDEDDPLIVTMTCGDCGTATPVTVPGAQTAIKQREAFEMNVPYECGGCGKPGVVTGKVGPAAKMGEAGARAILAAMQQTTTPRPQPRNQRRHPPK